MAFQINTDIQINATPQQVWFVFSNFDAYPEWNSFITSIKGDIQVNSKFKAEIGGMKFSPKVLAYTSNEKFQWIGRLFIPGIFDGKHTFELIENEDHTTRFVQKEEFKGILVPFMRKKLETEIKPKFETMNAKLKERVETT